jgi:hypothetical protein
MADVEGWNVITNGTSVAVGVLTFNTGLATSGPALGQPIYAAINGMRTDGTTTSQTHPFPVADSNAESVLATIASNTGGGPTATAQTAGNATLTAIAAAEAAGNVSLATIATAQGTAATGVVPPTGGAGVLGFLSGAFTTLATILATLTGTLTISGTVVANDGGAAATGVAQPTGGTGLMGYTSGIYNALVNATIGVRAVSRTGVAPDITTTGAGGTAQNIFNAGNAAAGGYFIPSVAGVVNQVGTALIAPGGANIAAVANVPFDLAPLTGAVSFISATTGVSIQGLGLK